jgi:hypothetical protein
MVNFVDSDNNALRSSRLYFNPVGFSLLADWGRRQRDIQQQRHDLL